MLLLTDTDARFGEATALRWSDVDVECGVIRIARSHSSGRNLGPTKTGEERTVELSTRLRAHLVESRPDICGDDTLVFPNEAGGFIDPTNFRRRVFGRIVQKAMKGSNKRVSPHTPRHTFASLHLARGSNLLWVPRQGGWKSPKVLLDTYAHFMPSELSGFADALSAALSGSSVKQSERTARRSGRKPLQDPSVPWWARRGSNPRASD
jgi:integrase